MAARARFVLMMVIIIFCFAVWSSLLPSQAATGALAAPNKTDTPTPTLDPNQPTATPEPTQAPTATPDPATQPTATPWVVILITPTPQRIPPSWQIEDLPKKIKDKKGFSKPLGLGIVLQVEPNPIPVEVDQTIANFMVWLTDKQIEYISLPANRYAQMLPSHSQPPADGVHEYPDGWYNHPTDQQYSWADINAFAFEPLPFVISVDQYAGPEGQGFVVCFTMRIDGVDWRRCINRGPESLRNSDGWNPVEATAP
jgi:hypothetical protein